MRKRIKAFCFFFCFLVLLIPKTAAKAINPIEISTPSSLTIQYKNSDELFSGLSVEIFRIASVSENGTFDLVAPFNEYKVNIYGITSQKEWSDVASTFSSYIVADKIEPYKKAVTDSEGKAVFSDVETGMYLIPRVNVTKDGYSVYFESFLSVLPIAQENGEHLYDVEAFPKSETVIPSPEKDEMTIVKQWKDTGFEKKRPENVFVDIYKNGVFHSTETLNSENNWSFRWETEKGIIWTAVERDISKEYTVTVTKNGNTIILTNVYDGKEQPPGKPGDDGAFWKYSIICFLSGTALVFLALKLRKGTD